MDPPETNKATNASISSESGPVQDSPIFGYISNLSPIKPLKAASVAQGFPGLNSPPLLFTSPRINPHQQSSFLKRPQYPQSSSVELQCQDDEQGKNTATAIYESEQPNTQVSMGLDPCTEDGHGNGGSMHVKTGSSSGCVDEYLSDLLEADCADSAQLDIISSEQSDRAPLPLSELMESQKSPEYDKDDIANNVTVAMGASPAILEEGEMDHESKASSSLNPVETDGKKGGNMPNSLYPNDEFDMPGIHASDKHHIESETENTGAGHKIVCDSTSQFVQEYNQITQQYEDCGETTGEVPSEQNVMLHDSKASQRQCGMRRRCLQFEEAQQKIIANSTGSWNQPNTESNSKPFTSPMDSEVLATSCADVSSSNRQLENMIESIYSMLPAQSFGNSSSIVSKPSGIGLHLNSIVSAMPMGSASASMKSTERGYLSVRGNHQSDNVKNLLNSLDVIDNVSASVEDSQHKNPVSMIATCVTSSPTSAKPLYDPVLLKSIENHATPCDKRKSISENSDCVEFTRSSPRKKRKKISGSSDGDGCKRCNCKKTKCLKLYCDCFAAGIYCAEPCSCQGCFNRPEYEDTVLETRQQIESRNPLAFAPKIIQCVTEPPANSSGDDNNNFTPSSARHKRGCNCKKSMCLKKYCECYQANVGCSDGCRCESCKNIYGKKEDYSMSKDSLIREDTTEERAEVSFNEKLEIVATRSGFLHSELNKPHNLTPLTPLFQCSDRGKDVAKYRLPSDRYLPSPDSDVTLLAPHSASPRYSDNPDMIQDTNKEILGLISLDQALDYGNLENADNSQPRCQRLGNIDPAEQASLVPETGNWSSYLCSDHFSSLSSLQWRSSPITPMALIGESKTQQVLDSDNGLLNVMEDDETPEILKDNSTPPNAVKVSSPNKKRVSPPHNRLHELGSSSSAGLRSGRRFILKAVPSFPPLTPCIDTKGSSCQGINDDQDCNNS